ncbi:helix-turn-helix domain-containing protein [Pedobacter punctiformis]|uniref:Helix-turn-helix domain-containing protein n=1 Tax=Pedobacter punctiformis TaxID=3004097 RepID=A0ABT4L6H3_9SPHI|nr:helix-turn-helix domain-containing protein [Pedobacter sp. HCMS5-2]MCZ4243526.1 helix-turn-helix domain-containing protein [Pedobacter sp. HCMS5-2]
MPDMNLKQKQPANINDIMNALNEYMEGNNIESVCKIYGIDTSTFYRWHSRYGIFAMKYYQMKAEYEHLKKMYQVLFESHETLYEILNTASEFRKKPEEKNQDL